MVKMIKVKMHPLNELGKREVRRTIFKLLTKLKDLNPSMIQNAAMFLKEETEANYKIAKEGYEMLCKYNTEEDLKKLFWELEREFRQET